MWFELLDFSKLGQEDRYRILDYLIEKLGRDRVQSLLGISRVSMWRLLNRRAPITDDCLRKMLENISRDEFNSIVSAERRLRALGVVRDDGTINYSLALELLALASRDEYLKQLVVRFCVENFREDLRKMLGMSLASIEFKWSDDFERYLQEFKKRRLVRSPETIAYYKNIFMQHLEGKRLTESLVSYVVNHKNQWLRNVFRHYVQYLYSRRKISVEVYAWLMEVVPSRKYKLDVREYPIKMEAVVRTLRELREKHPLYYLVYRLMLESGLRVNHALMFIKAYSPSDVIEVPGVDVITGRLVILDAHCRYYLGVRDSVKPCEWVFFSKDLLPLLEAFKGVNVSRHALLKYVKGHGLLLPKYLRKVNWRIITRAIPDKDVCRFIQSRLGEIA
ncbi:MAG: integrase, partial [Thermoprotei archaeon]